MVLVECGAQGPRVLNNGGVASVASSTPTHLRVGPTTPNPEGGCQVGKGGVASAEASEPVGNDGHTADTVRGRRSRGQVGGGATSPSPSSARETLGLKVRLAVGPEARKVIDDYLARFAAVSNHYYQRILYYQRTWPMLPRREQVPGRCVKCGLDSTLVCGNGPLCLNCHRPYSDLGLWLTLYPQDRPKTRRVKDKQTGVVRTRVYPARRPSHADNPLLVRYWDGKQWLHAGLTGTLHSEAYAQAVALVKVRRSQVAKFRGLVELWLQRVAEAETGIQTTAPCDYYLGKPRRYKGPRCKCERHQRISEKRRSETQVKRWSRALERAETSKRAFEGNMGRFRAPSVEGEWVDLSGIESGLKVRYVGPSSKRLKSTQWFGERLRIACQDAKRRVVYASILQKDGTYWLQVPLPMAPLGGVVTAGWIGLWPGDRHLSIAIVKPGKVSLQTMDYGLSGSALERARAGWHRHRMRAVKWQRGRAPGANGLPKRYRLNRKVRTTFSHVQNQVRTSVHQVSRRVAELAKSEMLGVVLPSFKGRIPRGGPPIVDLLQKTGYKVRLAGLPLVEVARKGRKDGCGWCGNEFPKRGVPRQATCAGCGRTLERGLHRALGLARAASA